ncbi:cytochrome P450 [Phellopilus nigrolimitatus]|nr:cytochrome P450 [Phellopilus nigrolimitatus]
MFLVLLHAVAPLCVLLFLWMWLVRRKHSSARGFPYPPGPKGLPLLGNVFDMPGSEEWERARQWGEQYGESAVSPITACDLVFIRNLGTPYLFVNSYDMAVDLLDKRGDNYSSRPQNIMLELEGWTQFTSLLPYGDEHRKSRQLIHGFFKQAAVSDFHELQTRITHKLLLRLLKSPGDFTGHIRHTTGELILMIVYGYQAAEKDDPYIELVEKGMNAAAEAENFFLVNAFPILRHLPEWFPGTKFLQIAKEGYRLSQNMIYEPFEMAKRLISEGDAMPSMTSNMLGSGTDVNGHVADEALIAKTASIIYAGGTDTTVSSLTTFILAMVLYPEAMRRGQEELDSVVGKDNLPTFEDRPNLPYINAICTFRWQPVGPLAVAHCATEDDVYNGCFIPAGTTIFPNVWAMARNAEMYPEPDKFRPERWLCADGKLSPLDVNKVAFGFGRRILITLLRPNSICPGRYFVEDSVFIVVASILSAFDIQKSLDHRGAPIIPKADYASSFISHPKPFKCSITPRSAKIETLINQATESAR